MQETWGLPTSVVPTCVTAVPTCVTSSIPRTAQPRIDGLARGQGSPGARGHGSMARRLHAATVARLACWHAPGTGGLHAAPEAPEPGADPQLQVGTDLAGYEIGLKRSAVHEAKVDALLL